MYINAIVYIVNICIYVNIYIQYIKYIYLYLYKYIYVYKGNVYKAWGNCHNFGSLGSRLWDEDWHAEKSLRSTPVDKR